MSPTTALRHLPPPDPPISVHSESSCLQSFPAFLKRLNARTFNVQTLSGLSPFSSTSKLLAATHVHRRNALDSFSFIALRTTFFATAGCVPSSPCLPTRLPRASRGRSALATPLVTSLECAVPRFRLLSPLECAVAKTCLHNSFRMRSYEKKGRGVPLPYLRQNQRPPALQIISPEGSCQAYGLTLLSKAKLPSQFKEKK